MNSAYKRHFWKFVVLAIYITVVLLSPLPFLVLYFIENETEFGESFVPKDADQFFKQYIIILRDGNTDQAYSLLSPETRQHRSTSSLLTLASALANITSPIERIDANVVKKERLQGDTQVEYDVTYEANNNDPISKFILINISATNMDGHLRVSRIRVRPTPTSVKEQINFDFRTQGICLIFSILLPIFIIYTAFRYLQKAETPTWWLFLAILLLTGFISFSNGSSVRLMVGVDSFVTKASGGPWVFSLGFPIGAIYYYFVRRKVEKTE
jgi:hypothetical protein